MSSIINQILFLARFSIHCLQVKVIDSLCDHELNESV